MDWLNWIFKHIGVLIAIWIVSAIVFVSGVAYIAAHFLAKFW